MGIVASSLSTPPRVAMPSRVGATASVLLAGIPVGLSWASRRWRRHTRDALTGMRIRSAESTVAVPSIYSADELIGVPDPVAKYFQFALRPGQRIVRAARVRQKGQFAVRPGKWVPFTAEEHFTASPPSFLWDARIHTAPLLDVLVRDAYSAGRGSMHGSLAGVFPVVHLEGTREMAEASLVRYLAEAVWFPTCLLPSAGIRWDPLDDSSARAAIEDGGTRASMDVHFATDGSISRVRAFRHREVKGASTELTPWIGRFHDFRSVAGMIVPGSSEIGWVVDGRWQPYWRGRNLHYHLEYR